jgi:hypothetical protein
MPVNNHDSDIPVPALYQTTVSMISGRRIPLTSRLLVIVGHDDDVVLDIDIDPFGNHFVHGSSFSSQAGNSPLRG